MALVLAAALLVGQAAAQLHPTHVVEPGDTLFDLAERYDTTVATLMELNGLSSSLLRVGQVLTLPRTARAGFLWYDVSGGETLHDVAAEFDLNPRTLERANPDLLATAPLPPGARVLIPPGDGEVVTLGPSENLLSLATRYRLAPSALVQLNGLSSLADVGPGDPVLLPAGATTAVVAAPVAADVRGAHRSQQLQLLAGLASQLERFDPGSDTFVAPLAGRISSAFGWRNISVGGNRFHGGVDIAAPLGTPVRAARDGVVRRSGWGGAYGFVIYLDHQDGSQTRYAHLSRLDVAAGAVVRQGDVIGLVGSSGASTGPHLHFEIRFAGRAVDPLPYLQ